MDRAGRYYAWRGTLVDAGGYGGVGITELLLKHPEAEVSCLPGDLPE